MTEQPPRDSQFSGIDELRRRAETLLQAVGAPADSPPAHDCLQVLHDLQVHQIELELQNEELRSTQKSLEESRTRFMRLFHQAPVGYVILDGSGMFTEVNITFAEMVGRDRGSLLGKPFTQVLWPEDRTLFLARFKAIMKNPEDKQMEVRLLTGELPLFVSISTSPHGLPRVHGFSTPTELFLTVTDISRLKRAEEALQASERLARSTVDALTAHIAIVDAEGTILFVNRAWRDFARANRIDPVRVGEGSNYFTVCSTASHVENAEASEFAEGIRAVLRGELELYTQEYPCHAPDENRWFIGRLTRFPGSQDRRVVVAHEDITHRKQLEQENLHLQRQLHRVEKEESLGRMAGAIAHHFNNQLFAIMGSLELVMEEAGGRALERHLRIAMTALDKVSTLSGRMLTYLGINTKGKQRIDLSATWRLALPVLLVLKPGEAQLDIAFPASGPMLMANPDQLRELLTNLVENCWESFDEQGGTIHLSLETVAALQIEDNHRLPLAWKPQHERYACLQVRDDGGGIHSEDMERIFDPFFSRKFLGRGMGLPLVLGIVRSHDGCITITSQPEAGTTIRVYLPLEQR